MSLADRIIDHGPYRGGDDNPFAGGVDYADLNDLRDRLIAGRGVTESPIQTVEFDIERWRVIIRVTAPDGTVTEYVADTQLNHGDGIWFGTKAEYDEEAEA